MRLQMYNLHHDDQLKLYINSKPDTWSSVVGAGGGRVEVAWGHWWWRRTQNTISKLTTFMFRLARMHWAPYTLHTQDLPHQYKTISNNAMRGAKQLKMIFFFFSLAFIYCSGPGTVEMIISQQYGKLHSKQYVNYSSWWWWLLLYSAILRSRADSLRSHVILHEWLAFYSAFLNIHRSGVLTALAWLVPHETAAVLAQVLCTPYNHVPCHFVQSHICKVYASLAVTCHLHF